MATWKKVLTKNDDVETFVFSGRQYLYGSFSSTSAFYGHQIWSFPASQFGVGYYNWTGKATLNNDIGPVQYTPRFNPQFVVPWDGKIINHQYTFAVSNAETVRYELKKGTPNYETTNITTLSSVGNGMTQAAVTQRQYFFEEDTSMSQTSNVSKGDILNPTFSKTTNLTSTTTRYAYGTWSVQIKKD